jgi:hypothetical protein
MANVGLPKALQEREGLAVGTLQALLIKAKLTVPSMNGNHSLAV